MRIAGLARLAVAIAAMHSVIGSTRIRVVLGRVMGAVAVVALLATGVLLASSGADAQTAAAPTGPRLAVVAVAKRLAELRTVDSHGRQPLRLAGGGPRTKPYLDTFSPPSWSSDGAQIAFAGITGFSDGDDHAAIRRIFVVRADGSGLRPIRGTNGASFPPSSRPMGRPSPSPAPSIARCRRRSAAS